jgi:tripartite-type tricarboxylate transporter receptor subunit TctC
MRRRWACVLAGMAVLASSAVAQAQSAAELKSLTIVVGSSAGGGYDTYARVMARHMVRYLGPIPGQASIVIQNMPGASSLKAVQYLDAAAPKDGSVVSAFNPGLITESLLNAEKIRLRFSDVAWIGSITRDLRVCYAWAATGIKTWDDLKRSKRFNMGRLRLALHRSSTRRCSRICSVSPCIR